LKEKEKIKEKNRKVKKIKERIIINYYYNPK
jgi:hypothetical protein